MTSVGWLHLADLHQTLRRPGWTSSWARDQLFDDLSHLHERCGPWELVIVAGDLSMRGSSEELDEAKQTLEALRAHLQRLGSSPCLLAVPGNHDLVRTEASPSALRMLRRWHDDPTVREEFWNDPDSPARRLVDRAFEPFERWWKALQVAENENVTVRPGLLPGDFTATIRKDGLCFGIAGLNSAFLQVTGDDYEGRLALEPQQLSVAAGGDTPAWIAQHHACVLVTHHGPRWLESTARIRYETAINPAGRFLAHLSAHVHDEAIPLVERGERLQIQCASFFGLDAWEDRLGRSGERQIGYNAGRLVTDDKHPRLEVFPRQLRNAHVGPARMLVDLDQEDRVTVPVTLFTPLEQPATGLLIERAALRDALSAVYRSPKDARRLAGEAYVHLDRAATGGAAVDIWHVVVSEAERGGRLGDLVKIARIEYPDNLQIAEAWAAFERAGSGTTAWPRRAPIRRAGDPVSAEEQIADTLHERLTKLQPAAFEAVLSLASLADQVPGSAAPQASRAIALVQRAEQDGNAGLERLAAAVMHVSGSTLADQTSRKIEFHGGKYSANLTASTIGAMAVGSVAVAGILSSIVPALTPSPRRPTARSLRKLLGEMFADERDFDGFCLDDFPSVYRQFTNGMDREQRIRSLVESADPTKIVASLQRKHPTAFGKLRRMIDYEEDDESIRPSRRG